jgi:cytochrome c oxidase assembly factor CtaG
MKEVAVLPPFGWHAAVAQWQFAPVVTGGVVIAAGLYLWGVIRVARRHPARPWPAWRAGMFLGGLAVLVIAIQSGIGSYDDVLFWDHMVQHLLLIMVIPPMLIAGQPVTLLLHASRNPLHGWVKRVLRSPVVSLLTWPPFGLAAYTIVVVGAHLTGIASTIETSPAIHNAEHLVFLAVGYLFFLPVLGHEPIRWRLSYPARFLILALAMPVDTFTGLILGYGNAGTPGVLLAGRPAWAPGPVEDLHLGGAVMWIGGDAIMFGLMMLVFLMWSRDEQASLSGHGWLEAARRANLDRLVAAGQARQAGQAGQAGQARPGAPAAGEAPGTERGSVDDDEHLAAYNAYLARLAEAQAQQRRRP